MEENDQEKGKTEILILTKKDEQERVQKKTFTNWVNTYLINAHPPYKIDDICDKIQDGLCLIHLLETMTGEKLRHENPRNMQRIHKLSNINTALEFLKNKKIKLVNINATDIADGKPAIVLGLIWSVILFFQIEEQEDILYGYLGDQFKGKGNAKKALLCWVNKTIGKKYNMSVTDFGSCWRDGKAFNALVHNINPRLINWHEVQNKDNQRNISGAFRQAEKLGIPCLIDPLDVDVEKPDEKSIMTYITQFLKAYPDGGKSIEDEIIAKRNMKEEAALKEKEEKKRKEFEEHERQMKEEECRRKLEAERQRYEKEVEIKRREEYEQKQREELLKQQEEEKKKRDDNERERILKEENINREIISGQIEHINIWLENIKIYLDGQIFCDMNSFNNFLDNLNNLLEDGNSMDTDVAGIKEDVELGICGKEHTKQFLSEILEIEKKLKSSNARANSIKTSLILNAAQLKLLETKIDIVSGWIDISNDALKSVDNSTSPEEFELKYAQFKTHLSDKQKAIEALKSTENIHSKLKSVAPKNLNDESLQKRILDLQLLFQKTIEGHEAIYESLCDFNNSITNAEKRQKYFTKTISEIDLTTDDIQIIKQQLDNIEKLKRSLSDDEEIIKEVKEKKLKVLQITSNLGSIQNKVISESTNCEDQWQINLENVEKNKKDVVDKLEKYEDLIQSVNRFNDWFKEKEDQLQSNRKPCDLLSEKQAQVDNLNKLLLEIESESSSIDKCIMEGTEISTSEKIIGNKLNRTGQLIERLKQSIKDALEDTIGKVKRHEDFNVKLEAADEWLHIANASKDDVSRNEITGNIEELQRRKEIIDQLLTSKTNGELLIKTAISAGDSIAKDSSSKGKEGVLNVLRALNNDIIRVFDGLGSIRQSICTQLVKASSIIRDLEILERWTKVFDQVISNISDDDLEKIKQNCYDAQSKMYMAENVFNQAKSLDDQNLELNAIQVKDQIKLNFENIQKIHEKMRENQKTYNEFVNSCSNLYDWLNDMERRTTRFKDRTEWSLEDITLSNKTLEKMAEETKEKRNHLEKIVLNGDDLSWSYPLKSAEIISTLDKLNEKHDCLLNNIKDIERVIIDELNFQNDFRDAYHKAIRWLNGSTQQLLKCSDIRTCPITLLNEFSRNLEDLINEIPRGEDIVDFAVQFEQHRLEGLRQNSLNEREIKMIRELDANWVEFKKQVDMAHKNLQRLKESQTEFEVMQERIQAEIIDKERLMRNSPSTEIFKYMLDDVDGLGDNIDILQKKATDISTSLSGSDAPNAARELAERYNKLKRTLERRSEYMQKEELRQVKRFESDWAEYKNTLNVCEKWIVDAGFRLIEHDFCADSPEDAQVKLDECLFICEEIENFEPEIKKMKAISKHMMEKIILTQNYYLNEQIVSRHYDSEIENDVDHLENSYQKIVANSHHTKSQLDEQLINWRKYRDIVQKNDAYLTSELFEWWREIKIIDRNVMDDVSLHLRESNSILRDLLARKTEMEMGQSNFQIVTQGIMSRKNVFRRSPSSTPLYRLAQSVEERITENIEEIERYIQELEKNKFENEMFDRDVEEIEKWIIDTENSLDMKIVKPRFKYSYTTDVQVLEDERLIEDIVAHEKSLNNLFKINQHHRKRQITLLLQRIEDLKRNFKIYRQSKDKGVDTVDYSNKDRFVYQDFSPRNVFSGISQTAPVIFSHTTSNTPLIDDRYSQSGSYGYGLRNSGTNRGLSKMLYPYCCTTDLVYQRPHLDFVHGTVLSNRRNEQVRRVSSSKIGDRRCEFYGNRLRRAQNYF